MNRVNNMRARLLSEFECEGGQDLCKMMKLMLKNTPSCVCNWKCEICKNSHSVDLDFLQVEVDNDLSKLNDVIDNRLKGITTCKNFCSTCKTMVAFSEFIVGDYLFIALKKNDVSLAQIPEVIKIGNENCILFGEILYIDPLIEGDNGHYVAAIKLNATWSIFDDKKSKSHYVAAKKIVFVHTLLYTKKSDSLIKNTPKTTEFQSGVSTVAKNSLKRKLERCKENVEKRNVIINRNVMRDVFFSFH